MQIKYNKLKKLKLQKREKKKEMKEERKNRKKKRKTPKNCKGPIQRHRFLTTTKSVNIHIYTHKQNQNSPTTTKNTINLPSEQRKPKIIPTRTKLTKAQTGKQRCQLENKAMKIKLTNILRGKERNKRNK